MPSQTTRHSYIDPVTDRPTTIVGHWIYDSGIETGDQHHPMNGRGAGWILEEITTENEFNEPDTEIYNQDEIETMYAYVEANFDSSTLR